MSHHPEFDVAEISARLLDEAHIAWMTAEGQCAHLLQACHESVGEKRRLAFLGYEAALEREEAAAQDLQRLWELTTPCRGADRRERATVGAN